MKTYIVIRDPGCTPDRKGPFPPKRVAGFLGEAMAARPFSYLEVITVHEDAEITVQDGPECLQLLDGRSMAVARRHNQRLASRRIKG